ncbi:MAG: response regulator [Gemmatimonadota bacterium]
MLRRTLARAAFRVLEAASGAEALRIVAARQGELDLVLTDVVMPGLSGREVAERIARARPFTTILYTSGYTEDEVLRRGVMGAEDRFLPKPFSPAALERTVRRLLASRAT